MFQFQVISALETVRLRDPIDAYPTIQSVRGLKGERVSFQIRADLKPEPDASHARKKGYYTLRSPLRPYTQVARIGHVAVELPAYLDRSDDDYISKEPGLFPDVLYPLTAKEIFQLHPYMELADLAQLGDTFQHIGDVSQGVLTLWGVA